MGINLYACDSKGGTFQRWYFLCLIVGEGRISRGWIFLDFHKVEGW